MINWIFCLFKFAVDDFYQRLPTELKMTAYLLLFTFCVIYLIVSLHTLFLFLRLVLTGTDLMIQIKTSVSNFLLFLLHDNKNKCKYVCGELCVFLNSSLHHRPQYNLPSIIVSSLTSSSFIFSIKLLLCWFKQLCLYWTCIITFPNMCKHLLSLLILFFWIILTQH